jgi:hypothetical protein
MMSNMVRLLAYSLKDDGSVGVSSLDYWSVPSGNDLDPDVLLSASKNSEKLFSLL